MYGKSIYMRIIEACSMCDTASLSLSKHLCHPDGNFSNKLGRAMSHGPPVPRVLKQGLRAALVPNPVLSWLESSFEHRNLPQMAHMGPEAILHSNR